MSPSDLGPEREDHAVAARLSSLREELPDDGFSAAMHRRLAAAGAPEPLPWWHRLLEPLTGRVDSPARRLALPALGVAVAVTLVLVLRLGQPAGISPRGSREPVAATLLATQVALVRINLSAEVAVQAARIEVRLPDGLVFWSDGQALADRSLSWSQPLRAGDNELPIPVRGRRPGLYRVTLTAQAGDQRIEDVVVLEVVDG
jgi:hypothetical protein